MDNPEDVYKEMLGNSEQLNWVTALSDTFTMHAYKWEAKYNGNTYSILKSRAGIVKDVRACHYRINNSEYVLFNGTVPQCKEFLEKKAKETKQ